MKNKIPKIFIFTVVSLISCLIFSNIGCKEQSNSELQSPKGIENNYTVNTQSPPKEDKTIGESKKIMDNKLNSPQKNEGELDDAYLKVLSIKDCFNPDFHKPKAGNKLIDIEVELMNNGFDKLSYNVLRFSLEDDNGYQYSEAWTSCGEPGFSAGKLNIGQKKRGFVAFEVPKNARAKKLFYKIDIWGDDEIEIELNYKK